ncbi:MAG: FAD-dependent oxidoreductase [Lentisphaeria bacterium]
MYTQRHYKSIILGAGFYACGLAINRENCLLVEPELCIGADFVFSFAANGCPGKKDPAWHPLTRRLYDELQQRKALKEGRLHPGALLPVFSKLINAEQLNIMLFTQICAVEKNKLLLQNSKGCFELFADEIIDARPRGKASLHAALQLDEPVPEGAYGELRLWHGALQGEAYISLPLDEQCSWQNARQKIKLAWQQRQPALKKARLLLCAARYFRSEFNNPFEALEAGLRGQRLAAPKTAPPSNTSKTHYDLIVAGLGTAGSCAAIAAAKRGLSCLVLERNTYAGGTQSGGFIPGFYIQKPTALCKKNAEEIQQRCQDEYFGAGQIENRKLYLEEKMLELGVEIRYGANVTGLLLENKKVKGLKWLENEQSYQCQANVVIDATAEAELTSMAGLKNRCGRKSDQQFQPFTYSMAAFAGQNVICWNFDAGCVDQGNPPELNQILQKCPEIHLYEDYSKLDRRILVPADLLGVREGRHIIGRQSVSMADFRSPAGFNDQQSIDYVYSNLDSHAKDFALESENYQDWIIAASLWGAEIVIPVPLGAILPEGIEGLILAGRHLDVDHDLGHAVRMNAGMGRLGECAGILAALAKKHGREPHEIPFAWLQNESPTQSPVPLSHNDSFKVMTEEEILAGLNSEAPGKAIWVAQQQQWHAMLINCLQKQGEQNLNLRRHAAFALALGGNQAALPELRECLRERDPFLPKTSRKENHQRGYAAAYLLGKMHDSEAIQLLAECLFQEDLEQKFQYHSYAFCALIRIAEACPQKRPEIAEILRRRAEDQAWHLETAMHLTNNTRRYDLLYRIHIAAALNKWGVANQVWQKIDKKILDANDYGVAQKLGL